MVLVIKYVSKFIIILNLLLILSASIYCYFRDSYGYNYISLNDEVGIASKCYMAKNGLFCKYKGEIIEVKQYGKR